ncbi:MAG: tryptophan 7-halogenase, partial [Actinomycetota bacterium]|nr:tryptophan 7-halogenase [Actinomycetota bacterium]
RIGETLPPEVRLPLERLGVWDRFQDGGHLPSPGIVAAWGGPEPYANDFILNPYGCGWRVDRNRFDSMLAAAAEQAGATLLTHAVARRCARAPDGGWRLEVTREDESWEVSAAFVVDATGRTSSFCRSLGGRRVVHDRLVALVGVAASALDAPFDQRALIEATEDGWWYSGALPDGRLVVAFHTDPAPRLRDRWTRYLAAAPETTARVGDTSGEIRIVSANSHRTDPLAAEAWLSVGDAGTAHDPLTGLGIHWALESGIAGAEAVLAALAGVGSATSAYGRAREQAFAQYLAARALYYRAENRWPHTLFWRRRRS